MRNYTFNFEVQTLLEQFVSAFNDIIIKRYNNNNTLTASTSGRQVRFVYAPKQRVYESLNTPAPGGITVPVVAVNITNISRDNTRVFNKLEGFNIVASGLQYEDGGISQPVLQPVPVNITVNMTIVTKFQSDMDQIITNFVPYCDPYIIISWKLPTKSTTPYELRSEILWNGSINMSYPTELNGGDAQRLVSETSFTIKGWLFKNSDTVVKKIYTIDSEYLIEGEKSILTTL
jgi:hypothetical protein